MAKAPPLGPSQALRPPEAMRRRGRKRPWGYGARAATHDPPRPGRLRQQQRRLVLVLVLVGLDRSAVAGVHAAVTELSWSSSSPTFPSEEAAAVASFANGDVAVCGSWQPSDSPLASPFVAKFSASGFQQWRRQDWQRQAGAARWYGDCAAVDVDVAADVYLVTNSQVGAAKGAATPRLQGDSDAAFAVLKLHGASGSLVWRREFGSAERSQEATSMRVAGGSAVFVGGFSRPGAASAGPGAGSEDADGFVMRLDAETGELEWTRRVASANGGDDRVFGVDADPAANAVVIVGDTTGDVRAADAVADAVANGSRPSLEPLHSGDLFVQRLDARTGETEWSRAIGRASTAEVCRLSAASIAGTDMSPSSVALRRGHCDVSVSAGGTRVFVTGTTVGGLLSTDRAERRQFQRLCASTAAAASSRCVHALLAQVSAASGDVQWLRQLVSRAGSSGERVRALAAASTAANRSEPGDVVMLATTDAGFRRADAMEQLAVLRADGATGETRWLVDAGGDGPDRAVALALSLSPPPPLGGGVDSSSGLDAAPWPLPDVLVLRSSARRRGASEPVATALEKRSAGSGAPLAFCRDVLAFGANATTVARPSAQTLLVLLPVYRVGGVLCPGSASIGAEVAYATQDGSAAGGVDFVASRGVLQLAAAHQGGAQRVVAAQVAVQVLPRPAARASVAFTVRLEAARGAAALVIAPSELRVEIAPPSLADRAMDAAASGAFWRRLTRLATLAAAGALALLLALRVGCARRLAWARDRVAFEYKTLSLDTRGRSERRSERDGVRKKRPSARWRWRRRRRRSSSSNSGGAVVCAAEPPPPPTLADCEGADEAQDEAELRAHLASVQSLNASLERLLRSPGPALAVERKRRKRRR